MSAVVVRPTAPEDLPGLDRLFQDRFGHGLAPGEWQWKYRASLAAGAAARTMVAVRAGEVVAHAGALAFPARLAPGDERPLWQLTDWAGSTAGGGLVPPLVRLGRQLLADLHRPGDAPWLFGFPSDRHFRLGTRVFGYAPVPSIQPLEGPLAAAAATGATGASGGGIAWSGDSSGPWAEEIWRRTGVAGVVRSAAFLNWRYHARPGRYYRFYRLHPEREGSEGFAVFAFVGRLALGAELWLPAAEGAAEPLRWQGALRAVAADLAASGLERWRLWPPPAALALDATLAALGLVPAGEPVPRGRRGPGPEDRPFYAAMGDHDLV